MASATIQVTFLTSTDNTYGGQTLYQWIETTDGKLALVYVPVGTNQRFYLSSTSAAVIAVYPR